jgi:membrane protein YqaA with SNARE-associated domain
MAKNYSLIRNPGKCCSVIKDKMMKNNYIQKIVENERQIYYYCFIWFSLNLVSYNVNVITHWVLNNLYWLVLGIFSSIGLGTGLQTGVLFVFPYILLTYNQNKDFLLLSLNENETFFNQSNITSILNLTNVTTNITNNFVNDTILHTLSDSDIYDLIYKTYFACLRVVLVWGVGTALGEAPPYFIAYTYDITNKKDASKLYKMFGDNEQRIRGYIDKTVYYLKKHSFTTILLLSAWPNALFDLCGVSAGLVRLSFIQFIIPTIIGKAFIKNPIQLGVILYYYGFFGEYITEREEMGYLYMGWIVFVILFTLYFIKEAIENIVNS